MNLTVSYNVLSKKELEKALLEQMSPEPEELQDRNFCVLTGREGAKSMHRAIERNAIDMSIEMLVAEGSLSTQELISINKMLDSPDDRDYELAKALIDSKYESNI